MGPGMTPAVIGTPMSTPLRRAGSATTCRRTIFLGVRRKVKDAIPEARF